MNRWFGLLLSLYPLRFRNEYGAEMLQIYRLSSEQTSSRISRFRTTCLMTLQTIPWLARESVMAFTGDFKQSPRWLQASYTIGLLGIAPFFIIVGYNDLTHMLGHATYPLLQQIGLAWPLYSIMLPSLTITVSIATLITSGWRQTSIKSYDGGTMPYGSSIASFAIAGLAVAVIM